MKIILIGLLVFFPGQISSNVFLDSLTAKKACDAYASNNFAQAESEYAKMLLKDPYSAQNNYNMGCVLHKQKKFDAAQNYFDRSIEHAASKTKLHEQALFNRGNNLAAQKKLDDAIADYKKVLKINPNNESAKKNLKACEQMQKEQKKQDQQKQKDKNKNQDKDKKQKDQNQKNDQNQNQKSDDGSNQDQQSSDNDSKDPKKDQKGNQKKSGKQNSQDQKGDAANDSQEKEERQQEQEKGLEKSKNHKSQEKEKGKKEKPEKAQHQKSSEKLNNQKSSDENKNGKDQSDAQEKPELHDAYAKEMMGKPSDDHRLDKKSAMLLDKLDDYEKNIQKKLLQMNVTKQGAFKHGQKNW